MKATPPGTALNSLSPYASFKDAAQAIKFYQQAFGAQELYRLAEPSGRIGHAEILIAGARMMLSDEYPDFGALSAQSIGGCPIALHLYVPDVDAFVARAIAAGATLLRPAEDQFYGDRAAQLADPFGYRWFVATRVKQVSPEEMQRLWTEALQNA